jgi:hypothetical protein
MGLSVRVIVRCDGTLPGPYEGHPGFVCPKGHDYADAMPDDVKRALIRDGWRFTRYRILCPDH